MWLLQQVSQARTDLQFATPNLQFAILSPPELAFKPFEAIPPTYLSSATSLELTRFFSRRNKKGGLLFAATRGLPCLAVSDLSCLISEDPQP
jgi:hypothetical protein